MDTPVSDADDIWVERQMTALNPPVEWRPDPDRAFERLLQRRETQNDPKWLRLFSTGAIVAGLCLVLSLLPWRVLWHQVMGTARNTEPLKAATSKIVPPIQSVPAAQQTTSVPAPEQKRVEQAGRTPSPPSVISTLPPEYTDEARKAKIQGDVILDVIIHADGTAVVAKVISGLGYGLDENAVAVVEQNWKFKAGEMDGKAQDAAARVVVKFRLL